MTAQFYVDETKAKGYLVVAATGAPEQLLVARKEIGTLLLPGQRSLHMKSEQDARRKQIAAAIVGVGADLDVRAVVYDAGRAGTERERRARCLQALVSDAATHPAASIVFDLDESLRSSDRQRLIEYTRAGQSRGRVKYSHMSRNEELLLAIPDIVAWCWAKGGLWRQRVRPMVADVQQV